MTAWQTPLADTDSAVTSCKEISKFLKVFKSQQESGFIPSLIAKPIYIACKTLKLGVLARMWSAPELHGVSDELSRCGMDDPMHDAKTTTLEYGTVYASCLDKILRNCPGLAMASFGFLHYGPLAL